MFVRMKNLDTAFRSTRKIAITVVCAVVVLCGVITLKCFQLVLQMQDRIYVLANGKALEAFAADRKDNVPVEAKDHVRMFHYYFFTLPPDEKAIQQRINQALYLADESAKQQYDNLKEQNYYSSIVSGNISQKLQSDTIEVNFDEHPFYFTYRATQVITRPTSEVTRKLVSEGYLRNVPRSDNNSHGFLIEKWRILENTDVSVKRR